MTPSHVPSSDEMSIEETVSVSVTGSRERSSSQTGRRLMKERPKLNVSICLIYMTNCSQSGLSRPYIARRFAFASGENEGSIIELTASPGIRRKSRKFSTSTAASTTSDEAMRRSSQRRLIAFPPEACNADCAAS